MSAFPSHRIKLRECDLYLKIQNTCELEMGKNPNSDHDLHDVHTLSPASLLVWQREEVETWGKENAEQSIQAVQSHLVIP